MAVTGSPADPAAPPWPLYDGNDTFLWLDSEIRPGNDFRKGQCDFWDYLFSSSP